MQFAPSSRPAPAPAPSRRNLAIAAGVVVFHVALLWALQSGSMRRAIEMVVPVALMTEFVTPPQPKVATPPPPPTPPQPPPQPQPQKQPVVQKKMVPRPRPAPQPVAVPNLPPAAAAPMGVVESQPAPPPIPAPVAVAPRAVPVAPPAPPAAPRVELPSSDADYLQNPKPVYPPMSKRLGEQGRVLVRVLIAVDGSARQAELRQSSGHDRLDQAALDTVRKWRFVPGRRNGVPQDMWFNVPISFVLE